MGRHSRYIAFLEGTADWQRLEFDFYDELDLTVGNVDQILVLIDSFVERADEYSIRNLDSAMLGCTADCEALSTNACRTKAKSERGACTDGINNDGFGFDGDGTIDCDDSDCWDDPACSDTGIAGDNVSPPPSPVELFLFASDSIFRRYIHANVIVGYQLSVGGSHVRAHLGRRFLDYSSHCNFDLGRLDFLGICVEVLPSQIN